MNTFGGYPLVDARCVREDRIRFLRDEVPELQYANSYYSMVGKWPDVGWVLLDRASYDRISRFATNLVLDAGGQIITGLSIVQARCVSRGLASDPNAVYLVQVTNAEGLVYNPWFSYPTNSQYNVRSPAYDTQYYSRTTNGGVAWTWDGMLGDLWGQATILGTYPHLPTTPTGTPEGFTFVGVPLWEAINSITDHLGMVVSFPPAIAVAGAADVAYSTLVARYSGALLDSLEYLDTGSGRVPKQVTVYFHRRNQVYGTEEVERNDTLQWQTTPAYSVTVQGPFASAVGTAHIWSDYTVRYDIDGNPIGSDATTANTIANERSSQYFNRVRGGGFLRDVYSGALPFSTGSQVDGVRWYHGVDGWCTEVVRGYVWPEVKFMEVV